MHPYREAPPPARPCPRCAAGLMRRALADASLDECRSCGGVFVDAELIPRIVDALDLGGEVIATFPRGAAGPGQEPTSGPTYLKCPRCAVIMNRRLFATGAKVIIDRCAEHGIWFDAAELRAVADFAAGGGMERAAERDQAARDARAAAEKQRRAVERERELQHYTPHQQYETSLLEDVLHLLRRFR